MWAVLAKLKVCDVKIASGYHFRDYDRAFAALTGRTDESNDFGKIEFSQELDHQIFPVGESANSGVEHEDGEGDLDYEIVSNENIDKVVDDIAKEKKQKIDLAKVDVLKSLHERFGGYYVKGLPVGDTFRDNDHNLLNEGYIGLIVDRKNEGGDVVGEDCIAISPVDRRDAGYVIRHDASEGLPWRDILSMTKKDARTYFNARNFKLGPAGEEGRYDAYLEKALALDLLKRRFYER